MVTTQRLREPPGPPVAPFARCQSQQNRLLLCPFASHSGQLQLMSLKLWGVERRPEPFPVGGVLIQDERNPGVWVLEYPLTNFWVFLFLVLMKNFLASSTAVLTGVALIESNSISNKQITDVYPTSSSHPFLHLLPLYFFERRKERHA